MLPIFWKKIRSKVQEMVQLLPSPPGVLGSFTLSLDVYTEYNEVKGFHPSPLIKREIFFR